MGGPSNLVFVWFLFRIFFVFRGSWLLWLLVFVAFGFRGFCMAFGFRGFRGFWILCGFWLSWLWRLSRLSWLLDSVAFGFWLSWASSHAKERRREGSKDEGF